MNVHIISLQRTGSKSLYEAVCAAVPDRAMIQREDGAEELGEFFHCWSFYGYKFLNSRYPFDPQGRILFRTHPDYDATVGDAYQVHYANYQLQWLRHHETATQLTLTDVRQRSALLHVMTARDKSVVVKTQLASLNEELKLQYSEYELLEQLVFQFDRTIILYPKDVVKWVCSNFVADHTGIFAACADQAKATSALRSTKVVIPETYIATLMDRLRRHYVLKEHLNKKSVVLNLATEDLSSIETKSKLRAYLGCEVNVRQEREFSQVPYDQLIANYDEVVAIANHTQDTL